MGRDLAVSLLRYLVYIITPLLVGCYDSFDSASGGTNQEDLTHNITIEMLHKRLSADGYIDVDEDLRIRGNVTAHDRGGNFYKRFFIEQDGYGVEILEGLNDSYVRHQLGAEVSVSLDGLRLARSRGVLQIGIATPHGSSYDLDFLGHEYIIDQHIINSGYVEKVTPRVVSIDELSGAAGVAFVERLCGTLVRIDGVKYQPTYDDDGVWGGDRCFVDARGSSSVELWCYTSRYSNYSMCEIPRTELSLVGIMQSDEVAGSSLKRPVLKMRDQGDCLY